jgi:tetratricopeptide (TPR) repeat protein
VACSTGPRPEAAKNDLPSIPKLDLTSFRPQLRAQVKQAMQPLEVKPADPEANGRLGMLFHAFEQLGTAETLYRRARLLDPATARWAYYLGLVLAIEGKNDEAASNLREAIRMDPGYVPARLKLAEALVALGRLDESREASLAILKDNPQVSPAYYWLGRADAAAGQADRAAEDYRKACELWPTYGTAHYALALLDQKAGRGADAQRHMEAYQKYKADGDPQPEDPMLEAVRAVDNSALAHLMKGVDLENAGQIEQAIAEHEEATRQDPKLAQAHVNLIALYGRSSQPQKAEQAYRAAVALNPNLPQSHYDYGVLLVGQQRFAEAETAFRKALESSPNYAEAHSNLGAMLERRGKLAEAAKQYRIAIDNKPNFREAHYQLGHLLLMQHKTPEAIAQLSQTLTTEDRETPRFLYMLGVAYAEAGDFASARRYLEQAGQQASTMGQTPLVAAIQVVLTKLEQRAAK